MILLTFNIINNKGLLKTGEQLTQAELFSITEENTNSVLRTLELHNIKSTFFVEIALVEQLSNLLKKISAKGHEIAFYNDNYGLEKIEFNKNYIEKLLDKRIKGIRQKEVTLYWKDLKALEINYVSNIENSNILFPFKRLHRSTKIQEDRGISIIPESISPYSQLPYNDFVFQIIPMEYYQNMVFETLKNDEFVLIYLNTSQFTDFNEFKFKVPFYRKWNSGKKMEDKLNRFLIWINDNDLAVSRIKDYII